MLDLLPVFAQRFDAFEGMLRSSNSATATLEQWMAQAESCPRHTLRARPVECEPQPASSQQRAHLKVSEDAQVQYRRVELVYDDLVLSTAENWYVPSRLTADMRDALADGTRPFGRVIEELAPRREMLSSERLWVIGSATETLADPPEHILRFQALVVTRDGVPICEVNELYTRAIVTFAA